MTPRGLEGRWRLGQGLPVPLGVSGAGAASLLGRSEGKVSCQDGIRTVRPGVRPPGTCWSVGTGASWCPGLWEASRVLGLPPACAGGIENEKALGKTRDNDTKEEEEVALCAAPGSCPESSGHLSGVTGPAANP